jgi:hypothetical protein
MIVVFTVNRRSSIATRLLHISTFLIDMDFRLSSGKKSLSRRIFLQSTNSFGDKQTIVPSRNTTQRIESQPLPQEDQSPMMIPQNFSETIERAKQKWKTGMTQTGKVVDYFEEVEAVLIRLNYPRDTEIVLDQVKMGLKSHIRTHFIGRDWNTLNEMKVEIIPYDSAYWEINVQASGEKTKTSSGSKAAPSSEKSKTPMLAIKTETVKTGTRTYLPQEEFEECKKEGLCFICKKEGKKVKGSARFHPNHLPQNTKNSSGKVAAMEVTCETDSELDSDKKSKN